jgi:hypothetical protein
MRLLALLSTVFVFTAMNPQPAEAFRLHFDCVVGTVKFAAPIVQCLQTPGGNPQACIAQLDGATNFLNTCCESYQNATSAIGQNVYKACVKLGIQGQQAPSSSSTPIVIP